MRKMLIVLGAVLALVGAACGGDGEEADGPDVTAPTGATAETGATGATGAEDCPDLTGDGAEFEIRISGFEFVPSCFTASASQGIAIVNEDAAPHTFTIDGTVIDVEIAAGDTFRGEPVSGAVEPGTYDFYCRLHPAMTGEVTIVA